MHRLRIGSMLAVDEGQRPVGMEFGIVSLQSEAVTTAISGFVESLLEAVAIVVAVLLLFMGLLPLLAGIREAY